MTGNNRTGFFRGKKVLVTGGAGFIGSSLALRLVKAGASVTVYDLLDPAGGGNLYNLEPVKNDLELVKADIGDRKKASRHVREKDMIFNLSGLLSHTLSMKEPLKDHYANSTAQLIFLTVCREENPAARIVYTGTRGEYGIPCTAAVDESHPVMPEDINGINKLSGELCHIIFGRKYGMSTCSLRLTNTYGPRHQMKNPHQGAVNWFIRQIVSGEEVQLYGDGSQVRDLNYVDDVVSALMTAMENENTAGEIFNLGGTPVSLKEAVEKIIELNGSGSYRLAPYPEGSRSVEVGSYRADYSKFLNITGWKPEIGIEEGFKKTLEYYKKNRKRYW